MAIEIKRGDATVTIPVEDLSQIPAETLNTLVGNNVEIKATETVSARVPSSLAEGLATSQEGVRVDPSMLNLGGNENLEGANLDPSGNQPAVVNDPAGNVQAPGQRSEMPGDIMGPPDHAAADQHGNKTVAESDREQREGRSPNYAEEFRQSQPIQPRSINPADIHNQSAAAGVGRGF